LIIDTPDRASLLAHAGPRLARFWCDVLDFVVLDRDDDGMVEIGRAKGSAVRSQRSSSVAGMSRRREIPAAMSSARSKARLNPL